MTEPDREPEGDVDARRPDLYWTPRSCLLTVAAILAIAALVVVGVLLVGRWLVNLLDESRGAGGVGPLLRLASSA